MWNQFEVSNFFSDIMGKFDILFSGFFVIMKIKIKSFSSYKIAHLQPVVL